MAWAGPLERTPCRQPSGSPTSPRASSPGPSSTRDSGHPTPIFTTWGGGWRASFHTGDGVDANQPQRFITAPPTEELSTIIEFVPFFTFQLISFWKFWKLSLVEYPLDLSRYLVEFPSLDRKQSYGLSECRDESPPREGIFSIFAAKRQKFWIPKLTLQE